ncbi:hypothetical protein [Rhizobium sp. SG_E_25_P2]|jgi:uncharacterized membrane protein|nr:hypothetical protein [Rhizobium sp. SG_E_25_P2]
MTKIEPPQKTERRASRRMIAFVVTLAIFAAMLAILYIMVVHPGAPAPG